MTSMPTEVLQGCKRALQCLLRPAVVTVHPHKQVSHWACKHYNCTNQLSVLHGWWGGKRSSAASCCLSQHVLLHPRLLGDLESHNEVLMAVALLEVVRRWQWVFVRVETELRKLGLLTAHAEVGDDSDQPGHLHGPSKGHARATHPAVKEVQREALLRA